MHLKEESKGNSKDLQMCFKETLECNNQKSQEEYTKTNCTLCASGKLPKRPSVPSYSSIVKADLKKREWRGGCNISLPEVYISISKNQGRRRERKIIYFIRKSPHYSKKENQQSTHRGREGPHCSCCDKAKYTICLLKIRF